jgi:hypothetical protein
MDSSRTRVVSDSIAKTPPVDRRIPLAAMRAPRLKPGVVVGDVAERRPQYRSKAPLNIRTCLYIAFYLCMSSVLQTKLALKHRIKLAPFYFGLRIRKKASHRACSKKKKPKTGPCELLINTRFYFKRPYKFLQSRMWTLKAYAVSNPLAAGHQDASLLIDGNLRVSAEP